MTARRALALLLPLLAVGCATTGRAPPTRDEARASLDALAVELDALPMPEGYDGLPLAVRALFDELAVTPTPGPLYTAARAAAEEDPSELARTIRRAIPSIDGVATSPVEARTQLLQALLLGLQMAEQAGSFDLRAAMLPDPDAPAAPPPAVPPLRRLYHRLLARCFAPGAPSEALSLGAQSFAARQRGYGNLPRGERALEAALALVEAPDRQRLERGLLWLWLSLSQLDRAEALYERLRPLEPEDFAAEWAEQLPPARRRRELLGQPETADRERELARVENELDMGWAALARVDRAMVTFPDDARLADLRYLLSPLEKGAMAPLDASVIEAAAQRPIADAYTWELRAFAACLSGLRTSVARRERGEEKTLFASFTEALEPLAASPALARENPALAELLALQLRAMRGVEGTKGNTIDLDSYAKGTIDLALRSPDCSPCWLAALPVAAEYGGDRSEGLLLQPKVAPTLAAQESFRIALLLARLERALLLAIAQDPEAERYRLVAVRDAPDEHRVVAEAWASITSTHQLYQRGELPKAEAGARIATAAAAALGAKPAASFLPRLQNFRVIGLQLAGDYGAAADAGLEAFPDDDGFTSYPGRVNALLAAARLNRRPKETAEAFARLRSLRLPGAERPDFGAVLRLLPFLERFARDPEGTRDSFGAFLTSMAPGDGAAIVLGSAKSIQLSAGCRTSSKVGRAGTTQLGLAFGVQPWLLATTVPGAFRFDRPAAAPPPAGK